MKLAEAIAILRAMEGPTLSDARALLPFIDDRVSKLILVTPLRRCQGMQCPATSYRVYQREGCVCEEATRAFRLLERARDMSKVVMEPPPERFNRQCAACRLPFSTIRVNERYCPKCNDTAKRKKRRPAA